MFTPRTTRYRARDSPVTPGSKRTPQSKRSSGVFPPQNRRLSSLRTASKANRSLQASQIVDDINSQYRVESFGLPLPVLITEALTLADRNTEITVNVDSSGWAWLVGGRKLFVWRYRQQAGSRNVQCKELTLPPSDLAHSAERVCIIQSFSDSQPAACVAVSPEGVVRYWPNIAYETSTAEVSAELKGEECACVINFQPFGCLLATTTSSLILLIAVPGQNNISCQPLKAAQGMFAGISRRMSSFIFGSSPMQAIGAPFQAIVPGEEDTEEGSRPFFVLSGTHLQKWEISNAGPEKLLYQVDVDRMFRETFARRIWDQDSVQMPQLRSWMIDMKTIPDGVMILGAGVNLETDNIVHFALATFMTDEVEPPSKIHEFVTLDHTERYEEDTELDLLSLRLLVPSTTAYVYDKKVIFAKQGEAPGDRLELQSSGAQILGAGSCDSLAVFFSSANGLFSVASSGNMEQSLLEESGQDMSALSEVSSLVTSKLQVEEMSASDDKSTRLKAAFINSLNGNMTEAHRIVNELFPVNETEGPSDLDKLVIMLSKDLIDDYPTSDPRWAESLRSDSASSTTSLIILQQLRDKEKAHSYLISFLKRLELWDRLRFVPVRDTMMATSLLLCEHAEKLEAAVALREFHSEQNAIIDSCIRTVLTSLRNTEVPHGLSPQDVFYREVSRVHELMSALLEYEDESLSSEVSPKQGVMIISSVNSILEGMLHSALQYRQTKAAMFQTSEEQLSNLEYVPWTSAGGSHGIRTLLTRQYMLTLESAVPDVREIETQGVLFQQLVSLADILLDGYRSQLVALQHNRAKQDQYHQLHRKYEQERDKLIRPLMDHEQYERAATLAEKYFDFENLVKICEVTKNQERLQRYTNQFSDKRFSDFLFNWYMKEGKRGRLLAQPVGSDIDLSKFLDSDNTKYLSWLHDISMNKYQMAHKTLFNLAQAETAFLAKKKTLLSLSKLAALAAEEEPDNEVRCNVEEISDDLNLILHQEQLPEEIFERLGLDPKNMGVKPPQELIELYIGENNKMASEYDFKKALDLLHYINKRDFDVDLDALRLHIWCRAVLQDSWTNTSDGDPLDVLRDTIFFKTIDLAYAEGADLPELVPSVEEVLDCEELGTLRHNSSFKYLLGVGYEHIQSICV